MKFLPVALLTLAAAVPAQTLQLFTAGTVARLPQPAIPPCSTAPEPYYFQITGRLSGQLQADEEVRLIVRPILLNGGPIFGCEWITQCLRPVPDAQGNLTAIGQFGTNNQVRSWFSGAQAQVQFIIVRTSANVGVCIASPPSVAVALSNVASINIDPTTPTLFDFQIGCRRAVADITGTPTPGQTLSWTLPQAGAVGFGLHDTAGFFLLGCQIYFTPNTPLSFFGTDAQGVLNFTLPNTPSIVGADVGTQSALLGGGVLDMTQPTLISVR